MRLTDIEFLNTDVGFCLVIFIYLWMLSKSESHTISETLAGVWIISL